MRAYWKPLATLLAAIVIALIPAPEGLAQHTWYYFAIVVGVIAGLMLEPLPGAAIGMIAATLVAILDEWVFFSPEQLAKPGHQSRQRVTGEGAFRVHQQHRVADPWRLHVRSSPVYFGSGCLPAGDYWRLGANFGVISIVAFLLIGVPLQF
ncbi:anion permease [Cupriavidus basilensis]